MCDDLYAAGSSAITPPLYAYNHVGTAAPCGVSGASSASVTGLAFYQASAADLIAYPAKYDGALFFVDYSRKCLVALLAGGGGVPDPSTMEVVATGLGSPVDLVTGPHGDLYYPDLDGGRIVRIRYVARPVAVGTATPSAFLAPGTVTLDASASRDPDPGASLVAWKWDLDHDGAFDGPADLSGATVDWPVSAPAVYPITLQVTSSNGLSDTAELVVDAANDPPVPVIESTDGDGWSVGDTVHFSGSATDAQDGVLGAAALTWDLLMHHCRDADCHTHIVESFDRVASGSFIAPDHEYPSHLELRLTATDSKGVTGQTSVMLDPQTTTISLNSLPAGLPLLVDGSAKNSPSTTTLIRGGATTVSAPEAQTVAGSRYRFSTWNDSPERTRDLIVTEPVSLTATYVPDAGDTCATASPVATGAWASDRPSGGGDEDWFRFTLGSKVRTIVTLGNLPVNARLELYKTCGTTRLAVSDRAGVTFEEITQVLAAGTYRVRVSMPSDDWSASHTASGPGPSPHALP